MAAANFYVYEHTRNDSGAVFYVGKGSGKRYNCTQGRNKYWQRITNKVGWSASFVLHGMDEEFAHLVEMELIAKYRAMGVRLANMTDGGEGMSGYSMPPEVIKARSEKQRGQKRPGVSAKLQGVPKSAEHRAALSKAKIGIKASPEACLKMSLSRKGRPSTMLGKRHSEETKAKISAALTGEKNVFFGKKHSPETIALLVAANVGRKDSNETRAKKSLARLGEKNPSYGTHISEERKARQISTLKATIEASKKSCPHCGRIVDSVNFKRWHGDVCKEKK